MALSKCYISGLVITTVKNLVIELDIMHSGLLELCGAGFAAEAQREQATVGTSPATLGTSPTSLMSSEAHVKGYAKKEKLLLFILSVLNLAWISDLNSSYYRINQSCRDSYKQLTGFNQI